MKKALPLTYEEEQIIQMILICLFLSTVLENFEQTVKEKENEQ